MASNSTLKSLVALTVSNTAAELIIQQVPGVRGSKPVLKQCGLVIDSIKRVRSNWPVLDGPEHFAFARMLEPIFNALRDTGGLPGHTVTWLARIFLEHVQNELWDCGSTKGGAIDDVIRYTEDLPFAIRSDDEEACRRQAKEMFAIWVEMVEGVTTEKAWRRVG